MIDKIKIARSFSRSARTYDAAAYFQREVGEQLLALMPLSRENKCTEYKSTEDIVRKKNENSICVDLGCGTGFFAKAIMQKYPTVPYLGVDIAEGMLRIVREQYTSELLLCADAEKLPLADSSVDLLFSNMALQWCENLPQLFSEIYRVLVSNGIIGLTTLGSGTLLELKQAWAQVDNLVHVNTFPTLAQWRNAIAQSGLTIEKCSVQKPVLRYTCVKQLLRELKQIGAHNLNEGQRQTLTGRKRLENLLTAYQQFNKEGFYPATYEVHYWVLKKNP